MPFILPARRTRPSLRYPAWTPDEQVDHERRLTGFGIERFNSHELIQIFHLLSDRAALIGNANRQIGGIGRKRRRPLYQLIQTPLVVAAMR